MQGEGCDPALRTSCDSESCGCTKIFTAWVDSRKYKQLKQFYSCIYAAESRTCRDKHYLSRMQSTRGAIQWHVLGKRSQPRHYGHLNLCCSPSQARCRLETRSPMTFVMHSDNTSACTSDAFLTTIVIYGPSITCDHVGPFCTDSPASSFTVCAVWATGSSTKTGCAVSAFR